MKTAHILDAARLAAKYNNDFRCRPKDVKRTQANVRAMLRRKGWQGYRTRRVGEYLVVKRKEPIVTDKQG